MKERVVVGLSGKPGARFAMYWALYYARPKKLDVELVHVVEQMESTGSPTERREALRAASIRLAHDVEDAKKLAPELRIFSRLLTGSPTQVLNDRAENAKLLVIGSHPLGRSEDMVYSTGVAQLAAESDCSVVVVPQKPSRPGSGIVVGVDGSRTSIAAVAFAAEMADRQRQKLTVVYASATPPSWLGAKGAISWPFEPGDEERLVIAEAVAGLAQSYPDLVVNTSLAQRQPVDALFAAARSARLVVVGSHGRHGRQRYWLGSVSYDLVLTMPCMVAVVKS